MWCCCSGLHEEAMRSFEGALALRPRSARALFHLGNAQFALQLYNGAETSFTSALKASTLCLAKILMKGMLSRGCL